MNQYYVYILANENDTLYIGVTNDLIRRIFEHKSGEVAGFTATYGLKKLVYYEESSDVVQAILREKRLKKWNRSWKLQLIRQHNPGMVDLYEEIIGSRSSRE